MDKTLCYAMILSYGQSMVLCNNTMQLWTKLSIMHCEYYKNGHNIRLGNDKFRVMKQHIAIMDNMALCNDAMLQYWTIHGIMQ